jgi:hypothetical protein
MLLEDLVERVFGVERAVQILTVARSSAEASVVADVVQLAVDAKTVALSL